MQAITKHSISRAAEDAVKLWALASTQYPERHGLILDATQVAFVEAISGFALNARRAMEVLDRAKKFRLDSPRWHWEPTDDGEIVSDLWDALNRIIHAQALEIGFVHLPSETAVIEGGAVVVPLVRAATDRKKPAFIDPFALSHAFLYKVLPDLMKAAIESATSRVCDTAMPTRAWLHGKRDDFSGRSERERLCQPERALQAVRVHARAADRVIGKRRRVRKAFCPL